MTSQEAIEPVGYVCPLKPRELQAARLISNGMPGKAVAHEMGLTKGSVDYIVTAACEAVGAKNRTELIAILLRKGWIE